LEYVFRPMRLRPMWPMYGTYIATLLGLALINETLTLAGTTAFSCVDNEHDATNYQIYNCRVYLRFKDTCDTILA
jgi:hypothetical protein